MTERQLSLSRQKIQCRICLAPIEDQTPLSPCDCRGSIQFVHVSCLKQYISHKFKHAASAQRKRMKRRIECEICKQQIPFLRVRGHKRCSNCQQIRMRMQVEDVLFLVVFIVLYLGFHAVGVLIILQDSLVAKILGGLWLGVTVIGFNYAAFKLVRRTCIVREAEVEEVRSVVGQL